MKKISIKDIAKLSGVSIATVSKIINNNGRYSEETKDKVLKIIEETGYQPNLSAKSLRMNKSFTIGLLVPDISNSFFAEVVQTIEEILFERGYSTIICNTARNINKEINYLKMLDNKMVDGLIVISGADKFSFSGHHKKVPYICIDREPADSDETIFISSNHYQGSFEATEELINSGAKFPCIITKKHSTTSSRERLNGFKDAMKKNNLVFEDKKSILIVDTTENNWIDYFDEFLTDNPQIDGIFAINDNIAIKAMEYLISIGKTVPKDIKIVGFDNSQLAIHTSPSLTSVKQDTENIALAAVDSLINLINGDDEELKKIQLIPVELIVRESTRQKQPK